MSTENAAVTPTANPEMPTMAEVAAKHMPVAEAGDMRGGTSTDPNVGVSGSGGGVDETEVKAEPAVEAPKAAVKEPPKDISSSRFAALARKEKDIRAREAQMETRLKEAEARLSAVSEKETALKNVTQNPLEALRKLGISYADITQAALGQYKAPEEDPVDAKLNPLKSRFDKYESNSEGLAREVEALKNQLAQKEQQTQYDTIMRDIRTASSDPEKYELIGAMGNEAIDLVRDTVFEYYNLHKKMLDYSEACDIVEKYYEDEFIGRLANTNKLKQRVQPAPKPTAETKLSAKEKPRESATLTNKLSSAPEANVDIDKLSKKEALEYLARKLKFTE